MPITIKKIDGKYSVRTPSGTKSYGTTRAKAKRQATLLRAIDHGWTPTKSTEESVTRQAQTLVDRLLNEAPLERGNVEPTVLDGGKYGKGVTSKGKTAGKFRFPRNWHVGHAIKS